MFGKGERRKIIHIVCKLNRIIYDATQAVQGSHVWVWPYLDTREDKVDPLRDGRISEVLSKVNIPYMERCSLLWSFGEEGDEKHQLTQTNSIATNSEGHFLVVDSLRHMKVFDRNGKFVFRFDPQNDDAHTKYIDIVDIATVGVDDRICLLVKLKKRGAKQWEIEVQVYNKTAELQHVFSVKRTRTPQSKAIHGDRLTVSGRKMLLLADNRELKQRRF